MLGARRRPDRGATTSRCRDIGEEEQQRDGPVPPQPFGRMGVAGDLFVVRRRRCHCIVSSSFRDLTSQAPSAYATVFMKGSTQLPPLIAVGFAEPTEILSQLGASPECRPSIDGSCGDNCERVTYICLEDWGCCVCYCGRSRRGWTVEKSNLGGHPFPSSYCITIRQLHSLRRLVCLHSRTSAND